MCGRSIVPQSLLESVDVTEAGSNQRWLGECPASKLAGYAMKIVCASQAIGVYTMPHGDIRLVVLTAIARAEENENRQCDPKSI